LATEERPLIVFIDALDQLTNANNARGLAWMPASLPPHVRLVVSCSSEPADVISTLRCRLGKDSLVELGAMAVDEGEALLKQWLVRSGRTLQPPQRTAVLQQFAHNGTPLYLRLAFEEARRWRSWDSVPDLPSESGDVIHLLLDRLGDEAVHGRVLVSRCLAYLAAARRGLSEDEIMDILSADSVVLDDFRRRSPKSPEVERLPVVI